MSDERKQALVRLAEQGDAAAQAALYAWDVRDGSIIPRVVSHVTKAVAESGTYHEFYHVTDRNADGTALRCRPNGKCQTWKTRPSHFRLPVKYGLKTCFAITHHNAEDWLTYDPTRSSV